MIVDFPLLSYHQEIHIIFKHFNYETQVVISGSELNFVRKVRFTAMHYVKLRAYKLLTL